MYGRRKYGAKRATVAYRGSRFGSRFGGKVAYRKKSRYTNRMKFAMVGYRRSTEKKYSDRTYVGQCDTIASGVGSPAMIANGVVFTSTHWGEYHMRSGGGSGNVPALAISNDMLKGLATGNDVRTRIGNKVKGQYVKGAMTFNAAYVDAMQTKDQGGETAVDTAAKPTLAYLRTTIRMCIVKDVQVNSADANVYWNSVFENDSFGAGVHSELKIDNMGRFIVLQDKSFTLDADDPQKTVQFMVSGSQIGSVRYNGPNANSLTDKGIYMIWSAFTLGAPSETGVNYPATTIRMSNPVAHSRFCFTDD